MAEKITHRELLPRGPKPMQPPANAAKVIEEMAQDGFTIVGIAKRMGRDVSVLNRWLDEFPELQAAFASGRENERYALHNMLYRAATEKGNIIAAMFLLKSRHSYVEGDQKNSENRVTVNFVIPGAMTPELYKTIELKAKK